MMGRVPANFYDDGCQTYEMCHPLLAYEDTTTYILLGPCLQSSSTSTRNFPSNEVCSHRSLFLPKDIGRAVGSYLDLSALTHHWPTFLTFATHDVAALAAQLSSIIVLPPTHVHQRACVIRLWSIRVNHH